MEKKCPQCQRVLPIESFRLKKAGSRFSWCRECFNIKQREYRDNRREALAEREYPHTHKECPHCKRTLPITQFPWNTARNEPSSWCKRCKADSDAATYAQNQEKRIEQARRYYSANRERCLEQQREYNQRTKEAHKEYNRLRSRKRTESGAGKEAGKRYRVAIKLEVLEAYGGAYCACCLETCLAMLTLDHIFNDGAEHRKTLSGGNKTRIYAWAKHQGFPPIFQVLCYNCNVAKFREGICPHKLEEFNIITLAETARAP